MTPRIIASGDHGRWRRRGETTFRGVPANLRPATSRELCLRFGHAAECSPTTYPKRMAVYTRTTTSTDPTTGNQQRLSTLRINWNGQDRPVRTTQSIVPKPIRCQGLFKRLSGNCQYLPSIARSQYQGLCISRVAHSVCRKESSVPECGRFDQPRRPAGLMASVEGANLVRTALGRSDRTRRCWLQCLPCPRKRRACRRRRQKVNSSLHHR